MRAALLASLRPHVAQASLGALGPGLGGRAGGDRTRVIPPRPAAPRVYKLGLQPPPALSAPPRSTEAASSIAAPGKREEKKKMQTGPAWHKGQGASIASPT